MLMILAQLEVNTPSTVTGLLALAGLYFLERFISGKSNKQSETAKIGELSEQTKLLREIRDQQEFCGRNMRKRVKRLRDEVRELKPKDKKEP